MRLALVAHDLTMCPQCGEDWLASAGLNAPRPRRLEFCPRCGSPAGGGYDPLRAPIYSRRSMRINVRAKLVVRLGVFGMGVIGLLTGLLLCYGGWLGSSELDAVQLWVSRVGGPLLLAQGLVYSWLPFRKAVGATILPFTPRR